jgi:hypothetical protein
MHARLAFVVLTSSLLAAVLVTPQLVQPTYSAPGMASDVQPAAAIGVPADPPADLGRDLTEDEVMDVYGNVLTAAVATYKYDAIGTLYELHSPQTELPRLASPKS